MTAAILETALPFPLARRGKGRDVYDLGEAFLFIATDRISAFDVGLSPRLPGVPNHLIETGFDEFPSEVRAHPDLRGRSVLVRKCRVVPIECVARGYLSGSGLKEYEKSGTVCGIPLEPGLVNGSKLREPIFTPATKEEAGHDANISFERMCAIVGDDLAKELRERTLMLYAKAAEYARTRGIIIADTKFEFGIANGEVVWIDEALTPDSSRFWPADQYAPGKNPPSFDKQFVRDWLETTGWNKTPPAPELPDDVVEKTRAKYIEAFRELTGEEPEL